MGKYNICVYAICKDEEKFADRWADSMSEADKIVVLDTGSTDGTVTRLRARGVEVTREIISPWRFDAARNLSLELVPQDADICVCTDLDEVFRPGWRAALEAAWEPGAGQAAYHYTWSFKPDGSEDVTFWYEKIHSRNGWRWVHPVHEILAWMGEGKSGPIVEAGGVFLDHHPDPDKSRAQYLPLLELSVRETPDDDRNMHYLGREYLFYERWDECIDTLKRHLALPAAVWEDERAASMRFIGKAYLHKGEAETAKRWYLRAVAEAPHLREPWVDAAMCAYELGDWEGVLYFTSGALWIENRPKTYICDGSAWGSLPHDLRSFALARLGRTGKALEQAELALRFEPDDPRLRGNVAVLKKILKGKRE